MVTLHFLNSFSRYCKSICIVHHIPQCSLYNTNVDFCQVSAVFSCTEIAASTFLLPKPLIAPSLSHSLFCFHFYTFYLSNSISRLEGVGNSPPDKLVVVVLLLQQQAAAKPLYIYIHYSSSSSCYATHLVDPPTTTTPHYYHYYYELG